MIAVGRYMRGALVALGGAIYLGLGYVAAAEDNPPLIALLAGILPLALIGLTIAWNAKVRIVAVPLVLLLCALAVFNLDRLRGHVALFYFVQHVGAMGMMALMFGSTLFGRHDQALCSRIAALVHPEQIGPDYFRYTWQVTLAWTAFFILCGVTSVALFWRGNMPHWALFANVATPVLTGLMFVAEYGVRVVLMPDRPHLSIAGTIAAYRKFRAGPP